LLPNRWKLGTEQAGRLKAKRSRKPLEGSRQQIDAARKFAPG